MDDLDTLYFYLFTTAIEGGVGYWARSEGYHWSIDGKGDINDVKGFRAILHDSVEGGEYVVDRSVIAKGIRALAANKVTFGSQPMNADNRITKLAKTLLRDRDGDYDAGDADNIVQAGLFGDIRYG